ncbi:hypothetical protein [Chloroflexus sp.]|uniref:hypothetical protein n=1 Tax=Chloroflexus sp. TaxID=1904827 RepID=UPI0026275399|nr:hypothetical protein [uncultured Chloroflexus sp.]
MSRVYLLSPVGRRDNLLMIVAAMLLWLLALWSFSNTLQLSLHPLQFWHDLLRISAQPPVIEQVVPALFLLVLIVATPLLVWNLIVEWGAAFTIDDEGLRYEAIGVRLLCRWNDVLGARPLPAVDDEVIVISCRIDPADAIVNPARRWLHRMAHGRQRLVIGTGVERRAELVSMIEQAIAHTSAEAGQLERAPVG